MYLVGSLIRLHCGSNTNEALAGMGGAYEFTRFASANLRQKDDAYNTALGGFLAGNILGLRCKS